jgi:hypothetical protein
LIGISKESFEWINSLDFIKSRNVVIDLEKLLINKNSEVEVNTKELILKSCDLSKPISVFLNVLVKNFILEWYVFKFYINFFFEVL